MASSTGEYLGQIYQHPGRRAPNVAALIRQHEENPRPIFEFAGHPAMISRIQDERQRHLEDFGDLERVDGQRERSSNDADDGSDLETCSGDISIEPANDRDVVPREPDLLLGLAQRRRGRIGVALFDAAAWERDLSGMSRQVRSALRQQYRHSLGTIDDRYQYGRRSQCSARRRHAGVEVVVASSRLPEGGGFGRIRSSAEAPASRVSEL